MGPDGVNGDKEQTRYVFVFEVAADEGEDFFFSPGELAKPALVLPGELLQAFQPLEGTRGKLEVIRRKGNVCWVVHSNFWSRSPVTKLRHCTIRRVQREAPNNLALFTSNV